MVIDHFVAGLGYNPESYSNKFKGEYLMIKKDGLELIALKPQTYMNLSGECVRDIINYFKIPPENVLIVCDDVNLPFARLRIRAEGSDGGHNGLKSIFLNLGTNKIFRLRVGVSLKPEEKGLADYVLENFSAEEQKLLNKEVLTFCSGALKSFIEKGPNYAMNNYNNKIGYLISEENAKKTELKDNEAHSGEKNNKI